MTLQILKRENKCRATQDISAVLKDVTIRDVGGVSDMYE